MGRNGNINQCEDSFNSSINRFKINRCDRFYLYCSLFLCALVSSLFFILKRLFFVSVFSSALFCFCLAIFVARIVQNKQSILGFCNTINLYALMSCLASHQSFNGSKKG
ncbi:hypothetical protein HMPREF1405_01507 [Helicobacter pylori GAM231Ai]|uniref:Uncharacterized protein n=1 Tax=Helicobacter pylori TaxID=210 RepID=A0A7Z6ST42_HELPX|nr:hypothetical protein HMPREF1405_01507 [Helicobacter pylori GAM231Ai]RKU96346.1 hypothetical protein DB721_02425 [Helicobacter pylori]